MSLSKLLRFNAWANRTVAEQIQNCPQELFDKQIGGSFGSLKSLLIHVLEADYLWLNRWKGIPRAEIPAWKTDTAADVIKLWLPMHEEMAQLAEKFENTPQAPIHFITKKGAPYTLPFDDIAIHVTNHATYHRGQLTHMMRELGLNAVSTDYFLYCVTVK